MSGFVMTASGGKGKSGFTLIEIIVVLLILGGLGVLGSTVLVNMVRSYRMAEENAHLAQKAQVAITRIAVELSDASKSSIEILDEGKELKFERESLDGTTSSNIIIGIHGVEPYLRLAENTEIGQGKILADRVTGFTASRPESHRVDIELQMTGSNNVEHDFTLSIATK